MARKAKQSNRLTPEQVRLLNRLLARRQKAIDNDKPPMSYREIGEMVGCSHMTVYVRSLKD